MILHAVGLKQLLSSLFPLPSPSFKTMTTPKPQSTPSTRSSSQHTRLKDFSVESQRRTFIAEQERERAAAENRRSSRRITKQASSATGQNGAILMSGLISRMDDDDSVGSFSVGSEESFYVGIERADYTSPDNLEMYGQESKEFAMEKEDRLGIGRVNVKTWQEAPDAIVHEESSSLYSFMTGVNDNAHKPSSSKKDVLVAMPLVVNGIHYKQKGNSFIEEDHSQVYQQEAAEGKMFINKLVEGGKSNDSSVAEMVNQTPAAKRQINTPFTTPGTARTSSRGHYPVISPMALFSPYIHTTSSGEDNAQRQLREREIRKDAEYEAKKQYDAKMENLKKDFRIFLLRSCTAENGFPVSELKKRMDEFMQE
jgi:hypothetical protein